VREEGSKAAFLNCVSQNDQSFFLGGLDFAALSCMYVFCTSTTLRRGLTQNHSWTGGSGIVQCHCKYARKKKTNQRQKKGDKSRQPERERERVTRNKSRKQAYLKRESRQSCNSLLHRDSHLPFLSFPFFFLSCSVLLAPLPQYQDVVARSNISVLALLLPVHIHTEVCLSYVQASAPA